MPTRPGAGASASVVITVLCAGIAIGGCANGDEREGSERDETVHDGEARMDGTEIPLPGTSGERGAWFDQRLGESRTTVLAALGESASSPRCTYSRLAPEGARRTFPMERCVHDAALLDPPRPALDELVTYFIDETLVRVEATFSPPLVASPDDAWIAALRGRLDHALDRDSGPGDAADPASLREPDGAVDASATDSDTWTIGRDRVRLFPGSPDPSGPAPGDADSSDADSSGADSSGAAPGGQGTPARLALYDARVALTLPELGEAAPGSTGGAPER